MFNSIIVAAALFSQGATTRELIRKAARLLSPGGRITIVHVMEDMPSFVAAAVSRDQLSTQRKAVRQRLESLVPSAGKHQVEIDLRSGKPSTQILKSAEDNAADLIMIASHKPGLSDYFIGSTAARVVRHANCSVLVSRRFV